MDKLDDYIKELDRAMPQFEVDDRLNECIKILSDLDEALDEFKNFDKMDYKIDEPFEDLWIGELEDGELKKSITEISLPCRTCRNVKNGIKQGPIKLKRIFSCDFVLLLIRPLINFNSF